MLKKKGGISMKKILKIFAMLIILLFIVNAGILNINIPDAKAQTPSNILLENKTQETLYYFDPIPGFSLSGTDQQITTYVYKMGEIIQGKLDEAPATTWVVSLQTIAGNPVDTVTMSGGASFSIGTGNVAYDGKYKIVATDSLTSPSWTLTIFFYLKYNIQVTNADIKGCSQTSTVSGYITRGSGQTILSPVSVQVAAPDRKLSAQYNVPQNSSGQFTLTFPGTPVLGYYYLFTSDGYPSVSPDNDAIIYYFMPNFSTTSWKLKEIVSNSILYNDEEGNLNQSLVVALTDQDGNLITGEKDHFYIGMSWYNPSVKEISKGIYKIYGGKLTGSSVNIYVKDIIQSNIITKSIQKLSFFNPYIDIDAEFAQPPYGTGPYFDYTLNKNVYDKLPVSLGNSLEISTGVFPIPNIPDPGNKKYTLKDNYYVYKTLLSFSPSLEQHKIGPDNLSVWNDPSANLITKPVYFVRDTGNISLSVSSTIWERSNQDTTPTWQTIDPDPLNACCAKKILYTFQLLKGTDSTPCNITVSPIKVTVNEGQDLSVYVGNISPIVHIYMVDGNTGDKVQDAFSVSYKMGREQQVLTDIWYNPMHVAGTNIPTLPISFGYDDNIDATWKNGSVIFSNVMFKQITVCPVCPKDIIVEVFTRVGSDTYPLCTILKDAITVNPIIITLAASYEIRPEGGTPTDTLLAGVKEPIYVTATFTNPDIFWTILYNGKPLADYGLSYTVDKVGEDLFKITFNKPLPYDRNFAPNKLEITAEAFNTGRTESEKTAINISASKPQLDTTPPVIQISEPENNTITNTKYPFYVTGKITDNTGIAEALINGQKISSFTEDGSFKEPLTLQEGKNTINIVARDYSGNDSEDEIEVTLDTIPPDLSLLAPAETTEAQVDVSGKTENDSIVKYGAQTLQNNNGNFQVTLQLKTGANSFSFSSQDKAGNLTEKTINITRKEKTLVLITIGSPYMFVNSEITEIDPGRGTTAVINEDRTLVPIRAVIEALGGSVSWDASDKKVIISLGNNTVELWIDNPIARINGSNEYIDSENHNVKPVIINGRTMLPLRFVAESLGCDVSWDPVNKSVTIIYIQ
jgi:hypothetical protein